MAATRRGLREGVWNMGVSDDVDVIVEAEFSGPPLANASATQAAKAE